MNSLTFSSLSLSFGKADHPRMSGELLLPHKKPYDLLLDTGFSLGIAFSKTLLPQFHYTDGFLSTVVLADERTVNAFTFFVNFNIESNGKTSELGQLSCIFMDGVTEPVAGIELMKLISPITFNWETAKIGSKLSVM